MLGTEDEEKLSKIEMIKRQSRHLRGTIKEALQDDQPKFSEDMFKCSVTKDIIEGLKYDNAPFRYMEANHGSGH